MADPAKTAALVLEGLGSSRRAIVRGLVRNVLALLHRAHDGEVGRDVFLSRAAELERAAATKIARDTAAGYRKVLEAVDVPRAPASELPRVPARHDWTEVLDRFEERFEEIARAERRERLEAELDRLQEAERRQRLLDELDALLEDDPDGDKTPATMEELDDEFGAELEDELEEKFAATERELRERTYSKVPKGEVTGWRRVVHPELSRGGACGLCVIASARVYSKPDLDPIHERCHCSVLPITKAHDPGDSLNRLDLGDLYEAAGDSTRAAQLKRVRVDGKGHVVARVNDKAAAAAKAAVASRAAARSRIRVLRKRNRTPEVIAELERLRKQLRAERHA